MWITTLAGNFYDKKRELAFAANSGEAGEQITANCKHAFGFSGAFGIVSGMSQHELAFANLVLSSGGAIHEPISGQVDGQEVSLDGKALINAKLTNCRVYVQTGDFASYGSNTIEGCTFIFHGAAARIKDLVLRLSNQGPA